MSVPELRPYQRDGLQAIAGALQARTNRILVKMPTGTGKTVMFAMLLKSLAPWLATLERGKGAALLVIAHREELLDQAADKIRRANPGLIVSIEQGDRHANHYSDVVIASIQTLAAVKFRRLEALQRRHTFRIVVVDEAHHSAAASYRGALTRLGFLPPALAGAGVENVEAAEFDDVAEMEKALQGWDAVAPRDRLLLGVTATPNRSDAVGLGCVFQSIAYSYALKDAIEDGWLVPIVPWVVETTTELDGVRTQAGDFNQKQLAEAVNTAPRNLLAVKAWQDYAADRSTIAFTVDVAHAHALAEAFRLAGVSAAAVSGETPKEERRALLARFSRGELQVITNCMVLTEGTDLPRTGCILHAKPTKSPTLYEQMTGRGLRLFEGKTSCIVIDLVDVARRHSLQSAPVLYGLPPSLLSKGKDLGAMAGELEELLEKYPGFDVAAAGRATLEQLRVRAATFDVWSVPALGAFGEGRALTWIRTSKDEYRLTYPWADGIEVLAVVPDVLGHFDVSLTLKPRDGSRPRQRTIAAGIGTAAEAANFAEAFVQAERRTAIRLVDREAAWRGRPASPKQIGALRALRVPIRGRLTMGQASDLIDLAKARRPGRSA